MDSTRTDEDLDEDEMELAFDEENPVGKVEFSSSMAAWACLPPVYSSNPPAPRRPLTMHKITRYPPEPRRKATVEVADDQSSGFEGEE